MSKRRKRRKYTKEARKKAAITCKAWHALKTPEEKAATAEKTRNTLLRRMDNMSPEEKTAFIRKSSKGKTEYYENVSKTRFKRDIARKRRSRYLYIGTPEGKEHYKYISQVMTVFHALLSPEEKREYHKKRIISFLKTIASRDRKKKFCEIMPKRINDYSGVITDAEMATL